MSVSPPLWSWAVEDGEPQMGTEEALIRQLASGQLPPYALVWREGWGEWLPRERWFFEEETEFSATLKAVRQAYELAGQRRQADAVVYYLV